MRRVRQRRGTLKTTTTPQTRQEKDRGPLTLPASAAYMKTTAGLVRQSDQQPQTGKFRTVLNVMKRLRWDPSMDASDYTVGYVDRFVGAQERPLEQWKTEQTDEEFIPQHRILYFKRKTDRSIVWERRTRIDDVFGSGVKADDQVAVAVGKIQK